MVVEVVVMLLPTISVKSGSTPQPRSFPVASTLEGQGITQTISHGLGLHQPQSMRLRMVAWAILVMGSGGGKLWKHRPGLGILRVCTPKKPSRRSKMARGVRMRFKRTVRFQIKMARVRPRAGAPVATSVCRAF